MMGSALAAVEGVRPLVPPGMTMAQFALRWCLMFDAVTCVIPGAKRPEQVEDNSRAADALAIDSTAMRALRVVYDTYIRGLVHYRW